MTDLRYRRTIAVACLLVLGAAPAAGHAQGTPLTSGDVPGAAAFAPLAHTLVREDWTNASSGVLPPTIAVVDGSMSVADERGRRFLRITHGGSFDLVLPAPLPEEYTIEFDMLVPLGTGYAVEVRPAMPGEPAGYAPLSRRARNPVATCGSIGAGVYGASFDATRRFDNALARALVPCQIAVSTQGVRVFFAGEEAAAVPNVSLGRASRIRFHVPAMPGSEALIGPIRVSTGAVLATPSVATAADGPGSAVPAATRGRPDASRPLPATASGTVTPSAGAPTPVGAAAQPSGTRIPGQTVGAQGSPTVTMTPQATAARLRAQQKTVAEAAAALAQKYGLALLETVKALAAGGYPAEAIATWLRIDHAGNVESVMTMLQQTGTFAAGVIAEAVWSVFIDTAEEKFGSTGTRIVTTARAQLNAAAADILAAIAKQQPGTPREWALLLGESGYRAHETAEALRVALQLDDGGVAAALRGQVSLQDLAAALGSSFNTGAERFAELLRIVVPGVPPVPPGAVAKALSEAYALAEPLAIAAMRQAGYPGEDLVRAMKEAYGSTPAEIVARLRGTMASDALAQAIAQVVPGATGAVITQAFKLAGAPAGEIAPALRLGLALDEKAVAKLLLGGGFDPTIAAGALKVTFDGITPEAVAIALSAAGAPPGPIATALVTTFQLAAGNVAALLASLGIQ